MAKDTLLTLKNFVTNQLGATDGATPNTKRDQQINRARRKYYSEHPWSFCLVPNTAVTITAQLGTLPTTFNYKFIPKCVYTYTGNVKFEYRPVEYSEVAGYTTDSYVYAIDKTNGKIYINQTTVSAVTMEYYQLPADAATDGSADSTSELANDITAIGYLAIAYWWLTSERAQSKYQLFTDLYNQQVAADKKQDIKSSPVKSLVINPRNLGYTRQRVTQPPRGYTSYR